MKVTAQHSCEFDANQLLNCQHRTESARRLQPLITCPKRDLAFLTQFPSLKRRHGKKKKKKKKKGEQQLEDRKMHVRGAKALLLVHHENELIIAHFSQLVGFDDAAASAAACPPH